MSIFSWFKNLFRWSEELKEKRFTVMDPNFPIIVYEISLSELKMMLMCDGTPNWWKEKYQHFLDESENNDK